MSARTLFTQALPARDAIASVVPSIRVRFIEWMAMLTVRQLAIATPKRPTSNSSERVLSGRNQLQVHRINAAAMNTPVTTSARRIKGMAGVVPLEATGGFAYQEMMNEGAMSATPPAAIAVFPNVATPKPATLRLLDFDFGPESLFKGKIGLHQEAPLSGVTGRAVSAAPSLYFTRLAHGKGK